jgi:signal transduction histidine kinase
MYNSTGRGLAVAQGTASATKAAEAVESRRSTILSAYENELIRIDSPLVVDGPIRRGCLWQANNALSDCVRSIEAGRARLETANLPQIDQMVDKFTALKLHPMDYLLASHVFLERANSEICQALLATGSHHSVFTTATSSLTRSVSNRIRFLARLYDSTSLDAIGEIRMVERRRLARDIHDNIGSSVTLAMLHADNALARGVDRRKAEEQVLKTRRALTDAMRDIQNVLCELHGQDPVIGVFEALRIFGEHFEPETMEVDFAFEGDDWRMSDASRKEIFLIICEALRNALAHSGGDRARVSVVVLPHEATAEVADNGRGFDVAKPLATGYGLRSMRDRAALLGGTCEVLSEAGSGTRVLVSIPLRDK